MRHFRPFVFLFVVLFLAGLACQGGASTQGPAEVVATTAPLQPATPAATATTQPATPTEPPQAADAPTPTDMPEPTAAPELAELGMGRSNPYPTTDPVEAPNWDIQVLEVLRGEEALKKVQAASDYNDPAPDEMEYLLVNLHVTSTYADSDAHSISAMDFDVTGDRFMRYMYTIVSGLEPELDAELFTGAETEGWIAFLVGEDEDNLVLIFDEFANWEDDRYRYIALTEGASLLPPPEISEIEPNDLGLSRTDPAAIDDLIITENWEFQVLEFVKGDEAYQMLTEENSFNEPPHEGYEYMLVKVYGHYVGTAEQPENFSYTDFEVTGDNNILYARPLVMEPDPMLDAYLFPGGETIGWVALEAEIGEGNLMLVFDKMLSLDEEAYRYVALTEGASIQVPESLESNAPNGLGKTIEAPAAMTEMVVTEDWEVQVLEVVRGQEAYDMLLEADDYNDAPDDGMEYVLVKVQVHYIGTVDEPVSIGSYDFSITGAKGTVYDLPYVTEPDPALDYYLYPDGTVEGWIGLQVTQDEGGLVLIFEPVWDWSGDNNLYIALSE